jgi:hypothetical protein
MNECYKCKNAIKGHPKWSEHYRGCNHPNAHRFERGFGNVGLKVADGAVESGWFDFPYNFDPCWIEECKGFEPLDE